MIAAHGTGEIMKRIALIGCALALAAGCSSTGAAGSNLGDTVYVDSGAGTPTPAGITRTDFDHISSAVTAKDDVGLQQLIASGVVVMVPLCAPAKLLDTALAGERQVRIASTGAAVWVDVNWLKNKASACSA